MGSQTADGSAGRLRRSIQDRQAIGVEALIEKGCLPGWLALPLPGNCYRQSLSFLLSLIHWDPVVSPAGPRFFCQPRLFAFNHAKFQRSARWAFGQAIAGCLVMAHHPAAAPPRPCHAVGNRTSPATACAASGIRHLRHPGGLIYGRQGRHGYGWAPCTYCRHCCQASLNQPTSTCSPWESFAGVVEPQHRGGHRAGKQEGLLKDSLYSHQLCEYYWVY